jgi:hypothetical protein
VAFVLIWLNIYAFFGFGTKLIICIFYPAPNAKPQKLKRWVLKSQQSKQNSDFTSSGINKDKDTVQ